MTNTPLNPDDEARLEKALEQSANGQVVSRGSFAQYAQTPLNQDGVLNAMDTLMAETDTDERATEWAHKVTTRVLEGYFAVAQPEVNSEKELDALPHETVIRDSGDFVFEKIGLHGKNFEWWCTTDFLNETKVTLPVRVLYIPEVKP